MSRHQPRAARARTAAAVAQMISRVGNPRDQSVPMAAGPWPRAPAPAAAPSNPPNPPTPADARRTCRRPPNLPPPAEPAAARRTRRVPPVIRPPETCVSEATCRVRETRRRTSGPPPVREEDRPWPSARDLGASRAARPGAPRAHHTTPLLVAGGPPSGPTTRRQHHSCVHPTSHRRCRSAGPDRCDRQHRCRSAPRRRRRPPRWPARHQ